MGRSKEEIEEYFQDDNDIQILDKIADSVFKVRIKLNGDTIDAALKISENAIPKGNIDIKLQREYEKTIEEIKWYMESFGKCDKILEYYEWNKDEYKDSKGFNCINNHHFFLMRLGKHTLEDRIRLTRKGSKHLKPEEKLTTNTTIDIFQEVCSATDFAHSFVDKNDKENVHIYRDIKPSNLIFVNQDDKESIKMMDFGSIGAFFSASAGLKTEGLHGTVGYIAPEVSKNPKEHEYTPKTDIYSLVIGFYQTLAMKSQGELFNNDKKPFISEEEWKAIETNVNLDDKGIFLEQIRAVKKNPDKLFEYFQLNDDSIIDSWSLREICKAGLELKEKRYESVRQVYFDLEVAKHYSKDIDELVKLADLKAGEDVSEANAEELIQNAKNLAEKDANLSEKIEKLNVSLKYKKDDAGIELSLAKVEGSSKLYTAVQKKVKKRIQDDLGKIREYPKEILKKLKVGNADIKKIKATKDNNLELYETTLKRILEKAKKDMPELTQEVQGKVPLFQDLIQVYSGAIDKYKLDKTCPLA